MVYFLSLTGGVDEPMVCNQSSFPFSLFFVSLLISFFLDLFIYLLVGSCKLSELVLSRKRMNTVYK